MSDLTNDFDVVSVWELVSVSDLVVDLEMESVWELVSVN